MSDDDGGSGGLGNGLVKCVGQGDGIGSVTFDDVPVPGTVFHGRVLAAHGVAVGRQLHRVAVVEHDQIAQPQVACNAGRLLGNAFLDTAVADKGVGLVGEYLTVMGCDEALGNGTSHSHHVALAQGAAGVFHTMSHVQLGMAGGDAAPAAECLQVVGGIASRQVQHAIEHGRHVAWIQEEAVTTEPRGVIGVGDDVF